MLAVCGSLQERSANQASLDVVTASIIGTGSVVDEFDGLAEIPAFAADEVDAPIASVDQWRRRVDAADLARQTHLRLDEAPRPDDGARMSAFVRFRLDPAAVCGHFDLHNERLAHPRDRARGAHRTTPGLTDAARRRPARRLRQPCVLHRCDDDRDTR